MNKVILLGNIGETPELRFGSSGIAILKLRIATNESWPDRDGQRKKHTEWHRATLFGKRAEALHPHLQKGSSVLVEGRLRTSSYERDGTKRYSTEIVVDELCFGSSGANTGGESRLARTGAEPSHAASPSLASVRRPPSAALLDAGLAPPPSWVGGGDAAVAGG
jgi:single-strand DNA-binding protein